MVTNIYKLAQIVTIKFVIHVVDLPRSGFYQRVKHLLVSLNLQLVHAENPMDVDTDGCQLLVVTLSSETESTPKTFS